MDLPQGRALGAYITQLADDRLLLAAFKRLIDQPTTTVVTSFGDLIVDGRTDVSTDELAAIERYAKENN